jgi:hypothetical protein
MKNIKIFFYIIVALLTLTSVVMIYTTAIERGTDLGLYSSYVLMAIGILSAIAFPIANIIKHPETGVKVLIGLGLLLAVFGLGYALSSNEVTFVYEKAGVNSPGASKRIGASLNMMYIMFVGVIGVVIFTEIRNLLK